MLYMRDRAAMVKSFLGRIKEIQDEPIRDVSELPFEFGKPVWLLSEAEDHKISYDPRVTAEGMLVRDDGVYYVICADGEVYLDPEDTVFFTKEAALAGRDAFIDTLDWKAFLEVLQYFIDEHEEEANTLLRKILPLYKEISRDFAVHVYNPR